MKTSLLLLLAGLFAATHTAFAAADWPRFRGPNGTGIASDAQPPVTWSESQNLKWKAPLPGPGTSSPIVVGERIFLTCWTGPGDGSRAAGGELTRHLLCVDRPSGKVRWHQTIEGEARADGYRGYLQEHGYASHTPTSDGERVYVYLGKAGALAFDLEGKRLWHVNLGQAANAKNWGSASSPVLYRDMVIINASEESNALYALDKRTGKQVWKAEGGALEYVFGTPVLAGQGNRTELLLAVPDELWSINPDNGKLWWHALTGLPGNIAPSVVSGDGVAYAFGGFPRTGAVAVKLGGKGDVTQSQVLWSGNRSTYIPTPVLHAGRLYFVSDAGFATCLEAKSGELIYQERLPGASASGPGGKPFYASPVLAGGNFYAVSRRNGVFVIAAKPEFKLVARNSLASDASQFNATPAVSGRQIFLRSDRFLYGIEAGTKVAEVRPPTEPTVHCPEPAILGWKALEQAQLNCWQR